MATGGHLSRLLASPQEAFQIRVSAQPQEAPQSLLCSLPLTTDGLAAWALQKAQKEIAIYWHPVQQMAVVGAHE